LDQKAQAAVIKTIPTQALKAAVGGGAAVSAAFAAAGYAGGVIGETISAVVMKGLGDIMMTRASECLTRGGSTVGVTLAGDFDAQYKLQSTEDVKKLRGFLALVPAKFQADGAPYWMGKDLLEWLVTDQIAACMQEKSIDVRYTIDV